MAKGKIMKDLTGKCPVMHGAATTGIMGTTNTDWWPNQLNLNILPVSYTHLTLPTKA